MTHLPRLERYLADVPGGLAGHPGALARGVLVRTGLHGQPRADLLPVLPEPLQRLVLDRALADFRGMSQADFFAWARERSQWV